MARIAERFVCQSCGAAYTKWAGRCDACGSWNAIVEEGGRAGTPGGLARGRGPGRAIQLVGLAGETEDAPRAASGIGEFDRVSGGGLVRGSTLLIGGDPGIGKSTLLLQIAAALSRQGLDCVYISGEEAVAQIRLRARRLGLGDARLELAAETDLRDILATLGSRPAPNVLVIDSIQTMYVDSLDSAPGTVGQLRAGAQELISYAKSAGVILMLVGHVTKEGAIAGPRVLEHMVDTVLYFEGERGHQFRILRTVKNRFGPTDEIGVFEMSDRGLAEVPNPSALFLSNRESPVAGAAVFAGIEGTRPMLVEVQALVAPTSLGTPRRAVVGWDAGRLAMVMAVLETRGGVLLGGNDIYLNVAGGLRISEPAADLAVAAALVSSLMDRPIPDETVIFGEISLAGEVRPVTQSEARLKEAAKLGFQAALLPPNAARGAGAKAPLRTHELARVQDLTDLVAGR